MPKDDWRDRGIPRWIQPPADEIPISIGLDLTLGATNDAIVYLSRPAGYSDALRFYVTAIQRRRSDLPKLINHLGISEIPTGEQPPDDYLQISVEYADGRSANNFNDDELSDRPSISLCGS